jgi:hypothetical protein
MKKFVAIAAVCLFAGISSWMLSVWADNCQQPNENKKACYNPDDSTGNCETVSEATCRYHAEGPVFYYVIEQFPDGAEPSSAGLTMTQSTPCWIKQGCKWNDDEARCEFTGIWLGWYNKQKTVVNPDGQCPNP